MTFFNPDRDEPEDSDEDDGDALPHGSDGPDAPAEFAPPDEDDQLIESSTIEHATVVIHAHPWQQPVDIITRTVDVQILADSVTLNGIRFDNPTRALTLENCRVSHDPREGSVDILTH